jgi:hypothetical protein
MNELLIAVITGQLEKIRNFVSSNPNCIAEVDSHQRSALTNEDYILLAHYSNLLGAAYLQKNNLIEAEKDFKQSFSYCDHIDISSPKKNKLLMTILYHLEMVKRKLALCQIASGWGLECKNVQKNKDCFFTQ